MKWPEISDMAGSDIRYTASRKRRRRRRTYTIVKRYAFHANAIMTLYYLQRQIIPWDSTCKITETLNVFNFNFNKDENKFLRLA